MNLTCEACKNSPATHIIIADFKSTRIKSLSCLQCGTRDLGLIDDAGKRAGYVAWLFRLVPEQQTGEDEPVVPPHLKGATWV